MPRGAEWMLRGLLAACGLAALAAAAQPPPRRLVGGATLYRSFDVHLLYSVRASQNFTSALEERALREVARLERRLTSLPAWRAACLRTTPATEALCSRGLSFANYALATWLEPGSGATGGAGEASSLQLLGDPAARLLPQPLAVELARRHGVAGVVLPMNRSAVDAGTAKMLRSSFRFRFACCTTLDPRSYREPVMEQLREDWRHLYLDSLGPAFEHVLGRSEVLSVQLHGSGVPGPGLDSCATAERFLPEAQAFGPSFQGPPPLVALCPAATGLLEPESCPLLRCGNGSSPAKAALASGCSCARKPGCGASERLLLVAPRPPALQGLARHFAEAAKRRGARPLEEAWSARRLGTAVAVGADRAGVVTEVTGALGEGCGHTEVCFCGMAGCELEGWQAAPPRTLPEAASAGEPAEEELEHVHVVWGLSREALLSALEGSSSLEAADGEGLLRFASGFEPAVPQAQRDILSFCQELPEELLVVQRSCWMEDFRNWLKAQDRRFPVPLPEFPGAAANFSAAGAGGGGGAALAWAANGTVRAFRASFRVGVSRCLTASGAMSYKRSWDRHLERWNRAVHRGASGAWHSSRLWDQIRHLQVAPLPDHSVSGGGSAPGPRWPLLALFAAALCRRSAA